MSDKSKFDKLASRRNPVNTRKDHKLVLDFEESGDLFMRELYGNAATDEFIDEFKLSYPYPFKRVWRLWTTFTELDCNHNGIIDVNQMKARLECERMADRMALLTSEADLSREELLAKAAIEIKNAGGGMSGDIKMVTFPEVLSSIFPNAPFSENKKVYRLLVYPPVTRKCVKELHKVFSKRLPRIMRISLSDIRELSGRTHFGKLFEDVSLHPVFHTYLKGNEISADFLSEEVNFVQFAVFILKAATDNVPKLIQWAKAVDEHYWDVLMKKEDWP
jgi:hypothetical protein